MKKSQLRKIIKEEIVNTITEIQNSDYIQNPDKYVKDGNVIKDFNKIIDVINSIKKVSQVRTVENMIELFNKKYRTLRKKVTDMDLYDDLTHVGPMAMSLMGYLLRKRAELRG